jgi:hypothetical protein
MTDLERQRLRKINEQIQMDGIKAAQALLPTVKQAAKAMDELAAAIGKSDLNSRTNNAFKHRG